MSNSIEEALQEAMKELLAKDKVQAVAYHPMSASEENKPCGFVAKLLDVKYEIQNGSTFGHKIVYIDKNDFSYDWHYGGITIEDVNMFRSFVESKLDDIKTSWSLDLIEIKEVNEVNNTAILFAVKSTTGVNADTFTIKVWKTSETELGFKVIAKTSVN